MNKTDLQNNDAAPSLCADDWREERNISSDRSRNTSELNTSVTLSFQYVSVSTDSSSGPVDYILHVSPSECFFVLQVSFHTNTLRSDPLKQLHDQNH